MMISLDVFFGLHPYDKADRPDVTRPLIHEYVNSPDKRENDIRLPTRPGVFQLVSWWDDADSFRRYMRSAEHRISHARIPQEPDKPRGTGVRRYVLLPDS
jgi:hypothetical protein